MAKRKSGSKSVSIESINSVADGLEFEFKLTLDADQSALVRALAVLRAHPVGQDVALILEEGISSYFDDLQLRMTAALSADRSTSAPHS